MEIASYCHMYIELGWCKKYQNTLCQYEALQCSINTVKKQIQGILKTVINRVPGLKTYMIVHSVFGVKDCRKGNWLSQFMISELFPTDGEIKEAHKKDEVPQEILDKLAAFEPVVFGFERNIDDKMIEYNMSGNTFKGEYPITIIDRTWARIGSEAEDRKKAIEAISKYETIKIR